MKRFWFCACVAAACGVRENPARVVSDMSSTLTALENDTKQTWQVRYQPDRRSVARLVGHTAPLASNLATAKAAATNFVMKYRALFGLIDADDGVAVTGGEADELGFSHVRLAQTRHGVPVWGSGLIVHFGGDGALIEVNGAAFALPPVNLVPVVGATAARAAAVAEGEVLCASLDPSAAKTLSPTLMLLPDAAAVRLVYAVDVENGGAGDPFHSLVFVDATSGVAVRAVNELCTLTGSGEGYFGEQLSFEVTQRGARYYLEDATRSDLKTYTAAGGSDLPGVEISSVNPNLWEPRISPLGIGVAVHAYVARTYDYFALVHGALGWSTTVPTIRATTHFGRNVVDAFYDGHQLFFGDGDGSTYLPPGAALSIVAHEYTHGWLDNSVGLTTDGDAAVVHEAFADVFAALVTIDARESTPWQIGWRTRLVDGRNQAVRDLADPSATSNPATLADWVTTDDPHVNSTILSHAAYLMATDAALGVTKTEQIWFRAAAHYLPPAPHFADAADALFSAASDLDPNTIPALQAALGAVGLVAP